MTSGAFGPEQRQGVYRAIYARRDIRNYRPDPVPDAVLERILRAAHHAPSVGMMQPWHFVLIRDRAVRQTIYDHFREVNARAAQVYEGDRKATYQALKLQGILDAPLNVLVTCDRRDRPEPVLGRFTMRHMDEYSTCLAVQNLWLAARAEGVGLGWMSLMEPEIVADALGLPEGVLPVAYLTMGYPVEFPPEPMLQSTGWRARHSLASHVFLDRWGAEHPGFETDPEQGHVSQPLSTAPLSPPEAAVARQRELTMPEGSLGKLHALGLTLAGLQQTEHPRCEHPRVLLFAGDHGVTAEGVSAYQPEVTARMVLQYVAGGAVVNALCRQHRVDLEVVDVGVDHDFGEATGMVHAKVRRGSRNFVSEAAMTHEELEQAFLAGRQAVERADEAEVLAIGEMGIGNTTAAAAVCAAVLRVDAGELVGRGTGVGDRALTRKRQIVQRGLELHAPADATEALRCLGGYEIAALVGAIEAAAAHRKLVVLDGFITAAAALVALARMPEAARFLVAGHVSAEAAHRAVLTSLGLSPLLDLDMRLGEGSGAVLALSLVQSAARIFSEVRTFEEANMDRPLDPRGRQ